MVNIKKELRSNKIYNYFVTSLMEGGVLLKGMAKHTKRDNN